MKKAYSYQRYSSAGQDNNDSLDRQTGKAYAWWVHEIKPLGIPLDAEARCDKGLSAYKGEHIKEGGALAAFLAEIKSGQIESGSILIAENLDRISRQGPKLARKILEKIVDNGVDVHIVNISMKLTRNWENDPTKSIIVDIELGRALKESEYKADRIGSAWAKKKRDAGAKLVTTNVPFWLEIRNGKIVKIPAQVAKVEEMFRLAEMGLGSKKISRQVNNGISVSMIAKTLANRSTLGEYQPHKMVNGKRVPDGDVIPDYYPPIITPSLWNAARREIDRKNVMPDRSRRFCSKNEKADNLFVGLLYDVTSRPVRTMYYQKKESAFLISSWSANLKANRLRYAKFEQAVVDRFLDLDWQAIANQSKSEEELTLQKHLDAKLSELNRTERRIATVKTAMDADDIEPGELRILARKLDADETLAMTLAKEKDALETALGSSRAKSEALATPEPLIEAISDLGNAEMRMRARTEIRKRVERIDLCFDSKIARKLIQALPFDTGEPKAVATIHFENGTSQQIVLSDVPVKLL